MDGSSKDFKSSRATGSGGAEEAQHLDLTAFLNFPSLSRLFQSGDSAALVSMRSQLVQTNQRLGQIARQGTKQEAERALLISRSYELTLSLLDELEQLIRAK